MCMVYSLKRCSQPQFAWPGSADLENGRVSTAGHGTSNDFPSLSLVCDYLLDALKLRLCLLQLLFGRGLSLDELGLHRIEVLASVCDLLEFSLHFCNLSSNNELFWANSMPHSSFKPIQSVLELSFLLAFRMQELQLGLETGLGFPALAYFVGGKSSFLT